MKSKMRRDLYKELFEVENKHWWHLHKQAVVYKFIERYSAKGRVLDVGAGTGKILSDLKRKKWQVFGIDGEKEALFWAKKRGIKLKFLDLEKERLPFKDNYFDLVLSLDTLEHLKNEGGPLKEIKRVLKPKGIVLITVPAYCWLFSYWDKMLGHKRRYNLKLLKSGVEEVGLRIEYLGYFFCLFLLPALGVRIVKRLSGDKTQQISDFQTTPLPLISLPIIKLYSRIEKWFLRFARLPFGLSILCVARRE